MTSEWPAEVFGGAVNDHVEAERERVLQHRAGEGVVDDGDEVVFFGEGDGFVQVDEADVGFVGVST